MLNSNSTDHFTDVCCFCVSILASEVYHPASAIIEQVGKASPKIRKQKEAKSAAAVVTKKATPGRTKAKKATQSPPSPVVQSLMEMGFSRKIIDHAVKITGTGANIERLVGWLLEHPDVEVAESESEEEEEEDIPPTGNDLASDTKATASVKSDTDSSSTSSDEEESDGGKTEMYKTREQFATVDEYAAYIKDHLHVGMTIQCCESYEEVAAGDIGKVTKVRFSLGYQN